MIHQPDFSVAVGDSSQNDEDAKNPPGYNVMVLEALSALGSNLNAIVNFIVVLHVKDANRNVLNIVMHSLFLVMGIWRCLWKCPKNPKEMNGSHKDDFTLTSFVSKAGYYALIEVFGEKEYLVGTPDELKVWEVTTQELISILSVLH
ncbi:hypothetical protein HN51_001073 [Arachis hypogaea]